MNKDLDGKMPCEKSNFSKVQLLVNLTTPAYAKYNQESQQLLTINSNGKVTLTRYFWNTGNNKKIKRITILPFDAEVIIAMLEKLLNEIKPKCYLLERGTVNIILTGNDSPSKQATIYLNDEVYVNGINVNDYIKSIIKLPEAVVFGAEEQ